MKIKYYNTLLIHPKCALECNMVIKMMENERQYTCLYHDVPSDHPYYHDNVAFPEPSANSLQPYDQRCLSPASDEGENFRFLNWCQDQEYTCSHLSYS